MYIDLQINGYGGIDFSDPGLTRDGCLEALERILATGTGVFLPTLITSPFEVYRRNVELIAATAQDAGLAKHVPGVHLEGPFVSPEPGAIGCHNPDYAALPDASLIDGLGGFVAMVTVAAELPGMEEFIRAMAERQVAVSLGHQLASPADLARAAAAGAATLTHLGNGIPNRIDRHRNPIWSGLACDELSAMIITDGHHLPAEVIKCFIRCKGVDRIIVTSDASPGAGLPPGRYHLFGYDVVLEADGKLHNPERGCLAGSASTMRECVRFLESLELLTPEELRKVSHDNAADLLRRNGRI